MEERGLAASTIDRRLSTVCGFYRFAHIDGRIGSNSAEYVRRPQVHPSDAMGLDRTELGMSPQQPTTTTPSTRRLQRGLRRGTLTKGQRRTLVVVSDAVRPSGEAPYGTSLPPADLTDDQLDAAPVLDSIDALVIEELSEDEDNAFAAALES